VAGFVAGGLAHSLVLDSYATYLLTDAVSIALALVVGRLAARPARGHYTFGLKRAEILVAQVNGVCLIVLAAWMGHAAVHHLISPSPVRGWVVAATALVGLVLTLTGARPLAGSGGGVRCAPGDALAVAAVFLAGAVMLVTTDERTDAVAALAMVALMVVGGGRLLRDSGRILLEAAPTGLDPGSIGDAITAADGVVAVADLHVWAIRYDQPALAAHVLVEPDQDCHGIRLDLHRLLVGRFGIRHTTMQVDHAGHPAHCSHGAARG
jgi:cobalt-zinc-cadmium efflux system protein